MRVLLSTCLVLISTPFLLGQCQSITLIGPEGMTQPRDVMKFRLESPSANFKYSWSVSHGGEIVDGQGTHSISVAIDKSSAGSNITATVVIHGMKPDCDSSASATAPVAPLLEGSVMDEWEGLKPNDERSRLDAFFAALDDNPDNTGVVVLVVTGAERVDAGNKRLQFVARHVRFRKRDLKRIWFVIEDSVSGFRRTKVYRLPPGAELMKCESTCVVIKGSDIR